jgi:hypothetical protein
MKPPTRGAVAEREVNRLHSNVAHDLQAVLGFPVTIRPHHDDWARRMRDASVRFALYGDGGREYARSPRERVVVPLGEAQSIATLPGIWASWEEEWVATGR